MDMGGDDDMDDMGGDEEEAPEKEDTAAPYTAKITPLSAGEQMREYVEKVSPKMGDNGANTKSTVASKNDMGGTAKNLTQAGTEKSPVEANKGQLKGNGLLKGSEKDMSTGNINVPGGKAAKANKPMPKGHGAEKRGAGDTATNKKSIIGSK